MIKEHRVSRAARSPREPIHRLIRDAVEAEEIAVDWLRWVGFIDARRIGTDHADGVWSSEVIADVTFDPLPMQLSELQDLVARAGTHHDGRLVSFTFAGWSPEAFAWAEVKAVPLIRFTFAGHVETNNAAAADLRAIRHD